MEERIDARDAKTFAEQSPEAARSIEEANKYSGIVVRRFDGRFRLYFNRVNQFPLVWAIDQGSIATKVDVCGYKIIGPGILQTTYIIDRKDHNEPSAWIEGFGAVRVLENGYAVVDTR